MTTHTRFYFIDNLRSLALFLGVVLHAAMAYSPFLNNIWFTSDPSKHSSFDYLFMWIHLFRMPLFFVIAGFCAALLVKKYGSKPFIMNRVKRVLLPFLVFLPITYILYFHSLSWGVKIVEVVPPIFSLLQEIENPQPSAMHLWFLWYLFHFCLMFWLLSLWPNLYTRVLTFVTKPMCVLLGILILVIVSLSGQAIPFPAPDKFVPQIWACGFFGGFFILGAGIYNSHTQLKKCIKYLPFILVIALSSGLLFLYNMPQALTLEHLLNAIKIGYLLPQKEHHILNVLTQSVAICSWTALVFILGYRFLNTENKISRYMSDASYWVYIIHVPVLFYIQMPMINLVAHAFIKAMLAIILTLIIGLLSYHFMVRNTWLGILLNGKRIAR